MSYQTQRRLISCNGSAVGFCLAAGFEVSCHVYNLQCHLAVERVRLVSRYHLNVKPQRGLENKKVEPVVLTV